MTTLLPNPLLGDVEILLVELEAEVVALLADGGDAGGARADAGVQNYPPELV